MKPVERFIIELTKTWNPPSPKTLSIIGSTALMLQTDYERGTRDSDVLETAELDSATQERLIELGGPGTRLARRWGMHVDIVAGGIPFLPQSPEWRPCPMNGLAPNVSVLVLEVADVVVSKLKRLNANDMTDIDAMVGRGLASHEAVLARLQLAIDYWGGDARAEDLPQYIENLHTVERDVYGEAPSEVELPAWIG